MHVLDLAPLDGSDPVANWQTIEHELAAHDPRLAALPRMLALSKADLVARRRGRRARPRPRGARGWATGRARARDLERHAAPGSTSSRHELLRRVPVEAPAPAAALAAEEELAEHRVFRPAADRGWRVEPVGDGAFRVSGAPVERLMARFDLDNEEALAHIEHRLHRMGVMRALEAAGFEPGDDVEIAGVVFELDPG